MTRPSHIHASVNIPPRPSFTTYFFSNPWPYAVSPLQAYILGVFGCLSTFVLYIFVSHNVYKMRRKRRARKARKNRTVEMGKAKSYVPTEIKDELRDNVNPVSHQLPGLALTDELKVMDAKYPHSKNDDIMQESNQDVTETNSSSYKLYEHMNSYPLGMVPKTSHGTKIGFHVVETNVTESARIHSEESDGREKLNNAMKPMRVESELYTENSREEESVYSDITTFDQSSINNCIGEVKRDELTQATNNSEPAEQSSSLPLGSSAMTSTLSSHIAEKDLTEAVSDNDKKDHRRGIKDNDKENDDPAPNEVMSTNAPFSVDKTKDNTKTKSHFADEGPSTKNTKIKNINEVLSIDSHLIVLLSEGDANATQAANQRAALELLDDLQLPYQAVDAQQEESFVKSFGVSDNYPQIFVCEKGQHRYLGGYDWLKQSIADISGTEQGTALLTALGQRKESSHSGLCSSTHFKGHIVVLVSNGVADYLQKSNQKSAVQFLTDLKIPHKIVDGMDASQHEERNGLFRISGIRGNYPQLFAAGESNDELFYLGGFDWLEEQDFASLAAVLG